MVRPRIKFFDVFGVLAVIAWIGVIGSYVYGEYFAPEPSALQAGVVFQEGESYMLLTREDLEVGYIHEARTYVPETDSWLLEYDLVMNVSMLGIDQYLQTRIKAAVNQQARLDVFSGTISTAGTSFELTGEVEGTTVVMKMDISGQVREQRIELNEAPRLANSALNELVGNADSLEPGMTFEQEYFDPTKMGMTTMTFEFVRRRTIDVYDEKVDTFHFRQKVGGTELDAYVDANGEVQLQEFPLRIVGARVPDVLGRARALAFNEKLESEGDVAVAETNLSPEAMLSFWQSGKVGSEVQTSRYRLSGITDAEGLVLESLRQKVLSEADGVVEIDTSTRGDVRLTEPPAELEQLRAATARVDKDNDVFKAFLADDASTSPTVRAETIARNVRKQMKPGAASGAQTASEALKAGEGDTLEQSLVLVAALRHHGIAARFVSGVRVADDGGFLPHTWVQYWDGKTYFADVDLTTPTMMPGVGQVQLFALATADQAQLTAFMDAVTIERILQADAKDDATPQGVDSDFN